MKWLENLRTKDEDKKKRIAVFLAFGITLIILIIYLVGVSALKNIETENVTLYKNPMNDLGSVLWPIWGEVEARIQTIKNTFK